MPLLRNNERRSFRLTKTVVHGGQDSAMVLGHFFPMRSQLNLIAHPDSIYRIPLQSPASTVQNIKLNALTLDTVLQDVEIKHPLVRFILLSFDLCNDKCQLDFKPTWFIPLRDLFV